jgi:hypothetical protein
MLNIPNDRVILSCIWIKCCSYLFLQINISIHRHVIGVCKGHKNIANLELCQTFGDTGLLLFRVKIRYLDLWCLQILEKCQVMENQQTKKKVSTTYQTSKPPHWKKSLTLLRSVRDVFLFFVYWKPNNGGRDHNQTHFGNTSQNPDRDRIYNNFAMHYACSKSK